MYLIVGEQDMAEKHSGRKPDIIFLNIVFCLLVIFIHIASEVVLNAPRNTYLFTIVFLAQRLSYFVVPGFIVLSGAKLFINKNNLTEYSKYYMSRILRVVIPYIFWACVYYMWFYIKGEYLFNGRNLLYGILTGSIWAHFYFVVVLIQFIILTPIWVYLYSRGNAAIHIAFALIITIISSLYLPAVLTSVFPSMPDIDLSNCFLCYQIYWTAGCLIGRYYKEFQNYLKHNIFTIGICFVFCAAAEGYLSLLTYSAEPVWMGLFHMLYAMAAILFFYMLAQIFTGKARGLLAPMYIIDMSSYMLYLMHCLVIVIVDEQLDIRGINDISNRFVYRAVLVYSICVIASLLWRFFCFAAAKTIKRKK